MKITSSTLLNIILATILLASILMIGTTATIGIDDGEIRGRQKKIQKDAMKVIVLDWTGRLYTDKYGYLREHGACVYYSTFPFVFSPKQKFLGVTDLWISITAYSNEKKWVDLTLDQETSVSKHLDQISDYPIAMHKQFADQDALAKMTPGIHTLTVDPPSGAIWVLEIVVLIEYEYVA